MKNKIRFLLPNNNNNEKIKLDFYSLIIIKMKEK